MPFAATIAERNEALLDTPHLVNVDPYGEGWIARLHTDDPDGALAGVATGITAVTELREWIDRYDLECMRCSE